MFIAFKILFINFIVYFKFYFMYCLIDWLCIICCFPFLFFFVAVLDLCCCAWAFSSCDKGALLQRAGFSLRWLLCCRAWALEHSDSIVAACGHSCFAECGIFPDQESNPCPLHWQAESQPRDHQESFHRDILRIKRVKINKALRTVSITQ